MPLIFKGVFINNSISAAVSKEKNVTWVTRNKVLASGDAGFDILLKALSYLLGVKIKVKHIKFAYTQSDTFGNKLIYTRLPLLCAKRTNTASPQQGLFKHSILINSIFSLTHKRPVYYQTQMSVNLLEN